jgi:hypothetical protein
MGRPMIRQLDAVHMWKFLAVFPCVSPLCPHMAVKRSRWQLDHIMTEGQRKHDKDLAKQLAGLELSERLSSVRLTRMQLGLPGNSFRISLLSLADAAAFLSLPAAEIPKTALPDTETQELILSRAAENLVGAVH